MNRSWFRLCPLLLLFASACDSSPLLGIVSPDAFDTRYLRLKNTSSGYVAFRVSAPGMDPLLTPIVPPGGLVHYEMLAVFGTLCPESLRIEMAAYERSRPDLSPLDDWSFLAQPYAAVAVDLLPARDFGCSADVSWLSINALIECNVMEVDPATATIGFQVGWVPPQRQVGVQLDDPPPPATPELFALHGRVVNTAGTPLPGVEIHLPQLQASVWTDAQGQFGIPLPAGAYVLEPVLPGVEVSPTYRRFSHQPGEVPIEFIALTDALPGGTP